MSRIFSLVILMVLSGCGHKSRVSATPSPSKTAKVGSAAPDTPLERQVLYYPNNKTYGSRPTGVDEVRLKTSDEVTLNSWYLPPPDKSAMLVYFHGNGGNLSSLGEQFETFRKLGVGVLAVDYRGFGKSEGDPSEQGLYLDGLAAFDKARDLAPGHPMVVFGRSLGGGVAVYVAAHRNSDALILESTFSSAKEVARYSHGEKGAEAIDAFDNLALVPQIKIPVFIFHGTADTTIPSVQSEALHQAIPNSELWLVDGATHGNLRVRAGDQYVEKLRAFLDSLRETTP